MMISMWKPMPGSTAPTRRIRTMPRAMMATACVRYSARHPGHGGGLVWWGDQLAGRPPAQYLADALARIPHGWPFDGWTITMEPQCPHCHETRLLDLHRTYLVCQVCGKRTVFTDKADPPVTPAAGPPE
jgi:hypothetical protein